MRIKDIGEIRLIKRAAGDFRLDRSVVKGSGDDTAVIRWAKNKYLLFTCDMSIEDVHFKLGEATPFQIGWKALGRNISDIAAMGGVSRYALVSIGINPDLPVSFLNGICKGMKTLADKFNINIVGGDMARSKKLVIDISLIGVTPRLNEARKLVKEFKINSMIDISDGLVLDLWRILNASKAGARIYQNTIPLSKDADSFEKAVYEGEDFELLFTMNAKEAKRYFRTALAKMETPVTLIGEIMPRRFGYKLIDKAGRISPLKAKGFLHF
ncbi:MAG: thiamine-monophosphate kinase [Candidatus Omnitrophica bacterium]|nr:thiamine-monophosphate kinase [Candidatus Omnitrophota bacterium]